MTLPDQRLPLGLVRGAYTTKTELKLPDDVSYDDWLEIGRQLATLSSASSWWVGDWFHYGQWEYGERKIEATEIGVDYQTARNLAYVAGRFKLSRRRDNLSFSHHAEVCPLDPMERDGWLDLAENEALSVMALRDRIREARALGKPTTPPSDLWLVKITAPAENHERWKQAADRLGLGLNDWAALTLDQAATQLLAA